MQPGDVLALHAGDDQLDVIVAKLERRRDGRREALLVLERRRLRGRLGEQRVAEEDEEKRDKNTGADEVDPLAVRAPNNHHEPNKLPASMFSPSCQWCGSRWMLKSGDERLG